MNAKTLAVLKAIESRRFPPTVRDLCKATDTTSTSVVEYYLNQLQKAGYIERERKIARGILRTTKVVEPEEFD